MNDPQREELEELLSGLIDENLDQSQWDRLTELVAGDEEARRRYRQAMFVEALMERFQADVAHADTREPEFPAAVNQPARIRDFVGNIRNVFVKPTPLSVTAAALVIGLLLTTMAFVAAPIYNALGRRSAPPALDFSPTFVAEITARHDVEWSSPPTGRALAPGEQLQLESGLLEVTFASGATVVLKGPADFVVDTPKKATLQHGLLSARIPPPAVGFVVATPTSTIVDLGTKFGVEIAGDGSGEVHVLEGSITLQDRRSPEQAGRVLVAGEAWKFSADGNRQQLARSDAQRFSFSVPKPVVATFQAGRMVAGDDVPYTGADDVMLLEWAREDNFGARADFDVGQLQGRRAHALLRFDLSPLEGKVDRILSATVILTPHDDVFYFPWKSPGDIALYRVSDANGYWNEGDANIHGNPAAPQHGAVSWNRLAHPDELWAGQHGAAAAGTDHDAQPLASVMYAPRTDFPLRFQIGGDLNFIQKWIDGQPNSGFLLKETTGDGENRINFHSSESENAAARPQLVIQYLPADTNLDATVADSETN